MRRDLLAAMLAALALPGCATIADPPGAHADATTADEQAALAVELAYKAARLALETAVDAGAIEGDAAADAAVLDERAYQAVLAARAAYAAGNAASYAAATAQARQAVEQLLAAIG